MPSRRGKSCRRSSVRKGRSNRCARRASSARKPAGFCTAIIAGPRCERESHLRLNADQQTALEATLAALAAGRHETFLLHGITGSGKTEVYIQTIQEVLRFGRQAIVLVPEISLTPQTQERFRARFGEVAVLHSHLSDAERHWQWQRIARGEVQLVVGARSAVFAPTPHLGLIVLDEEHEATFKQDTAPRVSCPRRGPGASAGGEDSAGAGLGDAVAGELASRRAAASIGCWSCRGA